MKFLFLGFLNPNEAAGEAGFFGFFLEEEPEPEPELCDLGFSAPAGTGLLFESLFWTTRLSVWNG